jgi:hypothetical protein
MGNVFFFGAIGLPGGDGFSKEFDFLEKAEVDLLLIVQDGLEDQGHLQDQTFPDFQGDHPEDGIAMGTVKVKFPFHDLGPEMVELIPLNFPPDFLDFF